MLVCVAVLIAGYVILTWPKKVQAVEPTVIVEPARKGDVEIYGEYVGRIRAQPANWTWTTPRQPTKRPRRR